MLKKLHIRNYAIIDELEIGFDERMNIITGETGAGKSILVGALSLILGDRAEMSVLLNREQKCFVEGVFSNRSDQLLSLLQAADIDADQELIIRREISANGKSRAFINDSPVNLDTLRKVSSLLVDLHRQFDTLELGSSDFQRQVIDALAKNAVLLSRYENFFRKMESSSLALKKLKSQKEEFSKEYDYNKFLFDELQSAAFLPNEIEDAETELKLLESAEGIKSALALARNLFSEGENPLLQQLRQIVNSLSSFGKLMPALEELCARLQSAQIELKDISDELERLDDQVVADTQKIDKLNERLSFGYRLFKKHGLQNSLELLSLKNELEAKLNNVLGIDEEIATLEKLHDQQRKETEELAAKLSVSRNAGVAGFQQQVEALLVRVGMPNARFKVDISKSALHRYGYDDIEFLFDANRSDRFEPIRKVASGGELSRLMLCIKSLVAASIDLPTMIFDEIDTGISGEAAKQVGIIMKELAQRRQLIAITHQPQIAGRADAHYFVYKESRNKAIKTNIRLLDKEESVMAIAKMLGGEDPSAAAVENAREMART